MLDGRSLCIIQLFFMHDNQTAYRKDAPPFPPYTTGYHRDSPSKTWVV